MENFKIGEYVKLSEKEKSFAKITYKKKNSFLVEQLLSISKTKNHFVKSLVEQELVFINKKMEIKLSEVKSSVQIIGLSEFVSKFYDFETSSFDLDKIKTDDTYLVRFFK